MIIEENLSKKRPLARPCLRSDDLVKREVNILGEGIDWKIQASCRENWRHSRMTE